MDGLKIECTGGFSELIAPLGSEINSWHWLIDTAGGISDSRYYALYDKALLKSRDLYKADLSMTLFRPYFLDAISAIFRGGEWSLYIGISADSDYEAIHTARRIDSPRRYSEEFFRTLFQLGLVMVLCLGGGLWQVYCSEEKRLLPLRRCFRTEETASEDERIFKD